MAAIEFALDPRDQERYGGPEWVTLDIEALDDLPYSVTAPWDRELVGATGAGISALMLVGLTKGTADGVKALIWLARKLNDIETAPFAQFDIRWRKHRKRAPKGDANPPASGSSEPPSETAR